MITLVGCESPQQTTPAVAEPVALLERSCGQDSDLPHAGVWLIQSQEQLAAVGSTTLADLETDFSQRDLAVIALGQQTTGGYSICISSIQQVGDTVYVQGIANAPADDAATTQQLTRPYCAVAISKTGAQTVRDDIKSVQGLKCGTAKCAAKCAAKRKAKDAKKCKTKDCAKCKATQQSR